jgi:hypothetical protein
VHLSLPLSEYVLEQQPFAHSLLFEQNSQSPLRTEVGGVVGRIVGRGVVGRVMGFRVGALVTVGGALENLSPANLLPRVNWYLLSLLQLRIRFNSELTPISDTLPSSLSTAPISNFAIERSTLKSFLVHQIATPSDYSCKILRW